MKICIEDGFFEKEDGLELNDIMTNVYKSFLHKVVHNEMDANVANEKINKYLLNMIKKYRIK